VVAKERARAETSPQDREKERKVYVTLGRIPVNAMAKTKAPASTITHGTVHRKGTEADRLVEAGHLRLTAGVEEVSHEIRKIPLADFWPKGTARKEETVIILMLNLLRPLSERKRKRRKRRKLTSQTKTSQIERQRPEESLSAKIKTTTKIKRRRIFSRAGP
jgi:hypothetical protein